MNTQLIILAAGKGTRMNMDVPKVLVELNGKPLIKHLLDSVSGEFMNPKPIIVVGFKRDEVIEELGDKYIYSVQDEQLGTAHAAFCGLKKAEAQNVIILYGDMPFIKSETLLRLCQEHESLHSQFSMLTAKPENFEGHYQSLYTFGRIIRDIDGNILAVRELVDASEQEKLITEVNPGIYIFNKEWLAESISGIKMNSHGEQYLTDIVSLAIEQGIKVVTSPVDAKEVLGVNTIEQLEQAKNLNS